MNVTLSKSYNLQNFTKQHVIDENTSFKENAVNDLVFASLYGLDTFF